MESNVQYGGICGKCIGSTIFMHLQLPAPFSPVGCELLPWLHNPPLYPLPPHHTTQSLPPYRPIPQHFPLFTRGMWRRDSLGLMDGCASGGEINRQMMDLLPAR